MRIGGLQKLTLLDYPGKVACTVFLSGCNLRCPYCHNPGLVLPEQSEGSEIPEAEVLSFLERRKGKLDGVCITGGEPTLQPELPEFLEKLRRLGYAVKLDTNGAFPERLEAIVQALNEIKSKKVGLNIIGTGTGNVSLTDVKSAAAGKS